jgi:hypothetical protein
MTYGDEFVLLIKENVVLNGMSEWLIEILMEMNMEQLRYWWYVYFIVIYITAIVLTPGGSSTVYIYT